MMFMHNVLFLAKSFVFFYMLCKDKINRGGSHNYQQRSQLQKEKFTNVYHFVKGFLMFSLFMVHDFD